jgi:hypothetical protein
MASFPEASVPTAETAGVPSCAERLEPSACGDLPASSAAESRRAAAAVGLALLALLGPVLVGAVPPLTDYPNHLARLWLEGGGGAIAPMSSMYRVTWDAVTNIGIDLFAVLAVPLLGYEAVGRILVGAAALLPAAGGVALWRVLHGRFHWWQIAFALLAWNIGLVMGFLNFEIGLGLALLAAAADPALGRRGAVLRAIARMALAGLLLLVHLFALVFYAALLIGIALGPELRPLLAPAGRRRAIRSILPIGAALAVPAAIMLLCAPSLPGRQTGADLSSAWSDFETGFAELRAFPVEKIELALIGVRAYVNWLDTLTLAAIEMAIVASLIMRRLGAHAGMGLAAGALFACYFVFPGFLAGTAWIDRRFALMALLALAAALRPDLPPRVAPAFAACFLALSLGRTGVVGCIWRDRQADVASVSRALESAPPGAAILPLDRPVEPAQAPWGRHTTLGEPTYRHLVALALPLRHAFAPTLFAARGKQPVRILAPWDEIAEPDGGLVANVEALTDSQRFARAVRFAAYLKLWRERFDYALLLDADVAEARPFVAPEGMTLVRDEGFARLYRIAAPGARAGIASPPLTPSARP